MTKISFEASLFTSFDAYSWIDSFYLSFYGQLISIAYFQRMPKFFSDAKRKMKLNRRSTMKGEIMADYMAKGYTDKRWGANHFHRLGG